VRHSWSVLIALVALSCSNAGDTQTAVQRGEMIYRNTCTVCHAQDPAQVGSLGPPVAGASATLLEAKVVRGEHPLGYEPKRTTNQMPRLAYLKDHIGDLAAYLDSVNR
jgi:mono/diheme cytochrome c family protein